MSNSSEVIIIGAGVIGSSIAYHLALNGIKNITVLEQAAMPGLGSTSKATGGFRAQFGSEINVKLSLLSRQKLLNFKDELGIDPCYNQCGYLFLAGSNEELSRLRNAASMQQNNGLSEVKNVTADEIKKLNPYINVEGIIGGSFSSTDGFISPMKILQGYNEGAKRLGVKFYYDESVMGFTKSGDKIAAVRTTKDKYNCHMVINAAGAWAGYIALLAGIGIPVKPLKRQVACLNKENILPENIPMTIFVKDSFHFRMRDKKLILLMPTDNENTDPLDTTIEDNWLENIWKIAKNRIPRLNNEEFFVDKKASWAGLYEMSPDEHILLGKAPGMDNFYMANGSSGHGVMHSPAIGQLTAELITGNKTTIDISPLRPSRFTDGEPIESIQFF